MLVFVSGVCGLFVVAFLFFRFRFFFTLTFFSHFHFFSHSPFRPHPHSPPHPHSRESGNLPVMPAEGGGFAPSALDREIPAFAGMGRGFCWFLCRVFADSLLSRFCFFASVFFTLPFFSHFHFFSHSPFRPHPHSRPTPSRESGNLPVMPAEGGGFAPLALDREIPAFAGMGRGGVLVFVSGVCRTLCCRVFVFSLPFFFTLTFFSHFHFFSHSPFRPHPHSPPTPFPRKRESPCDARRRRGIRAVGAGIGRFPLSREWKSGGGMERGGNGKGWGMEKGREWKRGGNGKGDGNGQGSGNGKGKREGRFSPKTGQKTKKTWCGFKCGLTHFLHRI